jgi:hypothetical protein
VTAHRQAAAAAMAAALGVSAELALSHPHALIGSPEAICETWLARRERHGMSRITVLEDGGNDIARAFAPIVSRLAGR